MSKKQNIETNMINIIDKFIESYDNIKSDDDCPLSLYNEIEIHSPSMTNFNTCCIKVINEASVVVFLHEGNEWDRFTYLSPLQSMGELRYVYRFDLKSYIETSKYEIRVHSIQLDDLMIYFTVYNCHIYPDQIKLFPCNPFKDEIIIIKSPKINSILVENDALNVLNIDVLKYILSKTRISFILREFEGFGNRVYRSIDKSFGIINADDEFYSISIDSNKKEVTIEHISIISEDGNSLLKILIDSVAEDTKWITNFFSILRSEGYRESVTLRKNVNIVIEHLPLQLIIRKLSLDQIVDIRDNLRRHYYPIKEEIKYDTKTKRISSN